MIIIEVNWPVIDASTEVCELMGWKWWNPPQEHVLNNKVHQQHLSLSHHSSCKLEITSKESEGKWIKIKMERVGE